MTMTIDSIQFTGFTALGSKWTVPGSYGVSLVPSAGQSAGQLARVDVGIGLCAGSVSAASVLAFRRCLRNWTRHRQWKTRNPYSPTPLYLGPRRW